jgi:hypothetical protein
LDNESGERQIKIDLANERLRLLYEEFSHAGIDIQRNYFPSANG